LSLADRDISIVSDIIDGLKLRMHKFIAFNQRVNWRVNMSESSNPVDDRVRQ